MSPKVSDGADERDSVIASTKGQGEPGHYIVFCFTLEGSSQKMLILHHGLLQNSSSVCALCFERQQKQRSTRQENEG